MCSKVDRERLPDSFPTHYLSSEFSEALGRTVATFAFLEEVLGRAIFALTATRKYSETEIEVAFEKWQHTLLKALSDSLVARIDTYGKAILDHPSNLIVSDELRNFLLALRSAAQRRNILCHGSWGIPDAKGASLLRFCTREGMVFDTPIDVAHLRQVQDHVASLICNVVDSVTLLGLQFPGSNGSGIPVWPMEG